MSKLTPSKQLILEKTMRKSAKVDIKAIVTTLFNQGFQFHKYGQLKQAWQTYQQVLQLQPEHFDALYMSGLIASDNQKPELAIDLIGKAIKLNGNHAEAIYNHGIALQKLNRMGEAVISFNKVIELNPYSFEAFFSRGNAFHALNIFDKALENYIQTLKIKPNYAKAYYACGLIYQKLKQFNDALINYNRAIEIDPIYFNAYNNRGVILNDLNRFVEALNDFDKAINLNTFDDELWCNRGVTLQELNRIEESIASYDRAIQIKPDNADAYFHRGFTFQKFNYFEEALASYNRAIEINPKNAKFHSNRATVFNKLNRLDLALIDYDKAIILNSHLVEAYLNRGNTLRVLNRFNEALASYDQAIELNPDYAEAYTNRGHALRDVNRLDEALENYNKSLLLRPDYEYLLGNQLHIKMHMCDWQDFEANIKKMLSKISTGEKASPSFPVLALTDSLSIYRKVSEIEINDRYPSNPLFGFIPKLQPNAKVKLAFLSADFKEHPMGYNFVGFFENIDKNKFEVIAVSFTNITDSPLSRRLVAAFDIFMIVDGLSDSEVCKWIRDQKVNIAIDMMGPTQHNRNGIFAMRCAPIQVNQFSWTSSAPYIDYIIADSISMPEEYSYGYSEKLAYVPHTLFATDNKREISLKIPLRSEQNLPEKGVIFCCFNNNFKITPNVFDVWMNILKNVPGSVLWIKGGRESLERNLLKEAEKRGLDPNRLVFAGQIPLMQDHLSRYRLADLFLDTFPFCAQTTASDALWAGVPVLTRTGESSMSRICSSLLNAIELPELITNTQAEYEARAIELGNNPTKLKAIKDKLERNRLTTALFDTTRFTKHIEAAYMKMYERYQNDLPPDKIYIDSQ